MSALKPLRGPPIRCHSGARVARARNLYSQADVAMADWSGACAAHDILWVWIPGSLALRAPRNDEVGKARFLASSVIAGRVCAEAIQTAAEETVWIASAVALWTMADNSLRSQ